MSTCSTCGQVHMSKCVSCGKASHRNCKCCAEHCTAVCGVDCLARAPLNSFGRTNKWGVRCCANEVRRVLNIDLAEFSIPDSAIAVGRTDDRPVHPMVTPLPHTLPMQPLTPPPWMRPS
jgi:hypothetical protein